MACDPKIAKLLSHIAACGTATLPGHRLPLTTAGRIIGYVTPDFAARLKADPDITVTTQVTLAETALARLNEIARTAGCRNRAENFDVRETPDGPVLAVLDRGALPDFGVIGAGAHLNGLVQRADGVHIWVAKRAANKKLDPGKLDHLVAGGISAGMTPIETLIKEAEEEAALPAALTAAAQQVGRFTYNMEREEGLRRDVIHAFDILLPESFTPQPADGEVESFSLLPLPEVFELVSTTDDFKFNVNLVLIDLFLRHGLVQGPDAEKLRSALAG
jgi:8-oxo-dGTP pyrophosphatase MutT (NUDIX family)